MAFVPIYILILGATIVIDFFAGKYIEGSTGGKRKTFLIVSLVANIGVLAVFKYYNFIVDNATFLCKELGFTSSLPYLNILLPIGLSFHTFQAMSYTIEVYRGNQKAEKHFGIYALYVMFYPQLVAGPIERPQNLLFQFYKKHSLDYGNVVNGLKLMLAGVFKKVVIADRLAIYVNAAYNNQENHNGTTLLIATIFFAFQIYCDFSGYSDMAIGAARVMGFDLMKNFNRPYFSKSVSEFWRRWHISLSTWFKDYLFIPLGGSRSKKMARVFFNLFFVFSISGLWHGASWTYVVWGALNGIYLIFGILITKYIFKKKEKQSKLWPIVSILFTFILICLSWVFFRGNNIHDCISIIHKILFSSGKLFTGDAGSRDFIYAVTFLIGLVMLEIIQEYKLFSGFSFYNNKSTLIRMTSYVVTILLILMFGVFDGSQFIYFQF